MKKLFVVTRRDLPPGLQAAQVLHAFREFILHYPDEEERWFQESNTICILDVPDEQALHALLERAQEGGLKVAAFREPDLEGELTALTLEPRAKSLCRNLPLALR